MHVRIFSVTDTVCGRPTELELDADVSPRSPHTSAARATLRHRVNDKRRCHYATYSDKTRR